LTAPVAVHVVDHERDHVNDHVDANAVIRGETY
jgi:hypothetical protein